MQHECCHPKTCKLYSIALIIWKREIKKIPPTATFGCPLNFSSARARNIQSRQKHMLTKKEENNAKIKLLWMINAGKYALFKLKDIHDTFPPDLNRKMNFIPMFYFSQFLCTLRKLMQNFHWQPLCICAVYAQCNTQAWCNMVRAEFLSCFSQTPR